MVHRFYTRYWCVRTYKLGVTPGRLRPAALARGQLHVGAIPARACTHTCTSRPSRLHALVVREYKEVTRMVYSPEGF